VPHSLPLLLVLHVQHTAHPAAESCTAQEAPAINRLSQPAHCMLQKLLLRWSQPLCGCTNLSLATRTEYAAAAALCAAVEVA
jgi:hypothetical protein